MEYDGNNELQQEIEKIDKMSPYDRLAYIRNLIRFYRQVDDYSEPTFKGLYERLMLVTKGYEQR
jgi:hypothetical protein